VESYEKVENKPLSSIEVQRRDTSLLQHEIKKEKPIEEIKRQGHRQEDDPRTYWDYFCYKSDKQITKNDTRTQAGDTRGHKI
jgi:hypothetical protein